MAVTVTVSVVFVTFSILRNIINLCFQFHIIYMEVNKVKLHRPLCLCLDMSNYESNIIY